MDFENTPLLESAGIEVAEKELNRRNYKSTTTTTTSETLINSMSPSPASQIQHNGKSNSSATNHHNNNNNTIPPTTTNHSTKKPMSAADRRATKKSLFILAGIFITSLAAMFYVYMIFPELNESEKQHMKIPRDIQDAKMLAKVLDRYKDMYYFEVMFGVVVAYVFLQTFAIPGSLFLSILLGFLYRFPIALFLICFCSSVGATLCYSLSNLVGRRLIKHFWPKKISEWSKHVDKHRDSLFNYMLFLRMTPILPNWFINLASPVIGVPLSTFAFGTFCGVAPPSVLAIQAGKTLQKMTSSSDAFSWTSMGILTLCACLSLVPGILKNKLKKKMA
ncbi:transmembrane protein stas [Haematobia irritans]|uniref:transmembrane protein stas n=1 Tax=Haematobia irritans TaxID=7368 RepID=UPI003F4FF56C